MVFIKKTLLTVIREEGKHRVPAFLSENRATREMSVFPKISLRLEVANYLKEGFMNEEVGQMNILDIYKHSDICAP